MAKRKRKHKRPFGEPRSFNAKLYTYRLSALSTQDWIEIGQRYLAKCDWLMRRYAGENPYGRGGALSFGWDWPTFSVLFPRVYNIKRLFVAEQKRRRLQNETTRAEELMALSEFDGEGIMAYNGEQLNGAKNKSPDATRHCKKARTRIVRRQGKNVATDSDTPSRDVRRYRGWSD